MKERYLIFSWLDQSFAVEINQVVEVLDLSNMVSTNKRELKLTSWNNRTMPVIDPVALLTIDQMKITKQTKIVIMEVNTFKVGFLVERIVAVEEINSDEIKEASIKEKRYVRNIVNEHKLVDFGNFVNAEILRLIKQAYTLNVDVILNGEEMYRERWNGKDGMLEDLKLESLNFLIESNRRKLDEYYLNGLTNIFKKIEKM
ncbi:chemotaxis protein CheW [Bacillus mexicanus]|uniref:chemotaxis protein CheW n=1 Tax=Bacillus mexicanus TaxID=2834415 RepID=UPI003D238437